MSIWRQHKINNIIPKVQSIYFDYKYAFMYHCDKLRLSTREPNKMNLEELECIWEEWEHTSGYWSKENIEISKKLEEFYKLEHKIVALYGGRENLSSEFENSYFSISNYTNLDSCIYRLQEIIRNFPKAEIIDDYGVKFTFDKKRLLQCPSNFHGEYSIPLGVETIGKKAFFECENITSVIIPSTVTKIELGAFAGCESLSTIVIPRGVTDIGEGAFNFSGLESIEIPNTIRFVADNMFWGCRNLSSVVIEDGITRIGDSAFRGCVSLETIHIPDSIIYIGQSAFSCCEKLAYIHLSNQLKDISSDTFGGCKALTSIIIPLGIESIRFEAFSWCEKLVEVTLPKSIKVIDNCAFSMCNNIKNILIPKYEKERFSKMEGLEGMVDLLIERDSI